MSSAERSVERSAERECLCGVTVPAHSFCTMQFSFFPQGVPSGQFAILLPVFVRRLADYARQAATRLCYRYPATLRYAGQAPGKLPTAPTTYSRSSLFPVCAFCGSFTPVSSLQPQVPSHRPSLFALPSLCVLGVPSTSPSASLRAGLRLARWATPRGAGLAVLFLPPRPAHYHGG